MIRTIKLLFASLLFCLVTNSSTYAMSFGDLQKGIDAASSIKEMSDEQKEEQEQEKTERITYAEGIVEKVNELSSVFDVSTDVEDKALDLEEELLECVDQSVKDCDGKKVRLSARKLDRELKGPQKEYQRIVEEQEKEEQRVAEEKRAEERRLAEEKRAEEEGKRAEEQKVAKANRIAQEKEKVATQRNDLISSLREMGAFEEQSMFSSEPSALANQTSDMSLSQLKLANVSYLGMQRYKDASNDMQKGASRVKRKKDLCALKHAEFTGSIGIIESMGFNQEGKGTLSISIAENVILQTASLEFTDKLYSASTLIDPTSKLGTEVMELAEGELVRFDGNLISASRGYSNDTGDDCVVENSASFAGSLTSPEFLFNFTSVKKI